MGADPARIEALLAALTLEEKVTLVAGRDLWRTGAAPRLGIPGLKSTDGPSGARGDSRDEELTSACFPCGAALGATFSPSLVERVGAALAEEARSKGAHVLLAPTVNLQRTPLGGRHFECYSEDPHLSARLAAAFVRGVQSRGVAACVKHFVCNDAETERMSISVRVSERALRELYLPPFEAAVREAGVWSLMAAYNRFEDVHCSEHPGLLTGILRDEWGFDGVVVSDWFGTHGGAPALEAGLDLEMPGPSRHRGPRLVEAARRGELDAAALDEAVRRLLRLMLRTGALDEAEPRAERVEDRPEHRALAREAARESLVLLRNVGGCLPLDPRRVRRLALLGPNAAVARLQGGGSARVRPHRAVSALEGLAARDAFAIVYEPGCTIDRALPELDLNWVRPGPGADAPGLLAEYFDGFEPKGEPRLRRRTRLARFTWLGPFAEEVDFRRFSLRLSGVFTPPVGGGWTFSLTSAGKSRLRLDGEELVDNWDGYTRGDSFFGLGSTEVRAAVTLEAGRAYRLEVDYTREGAPLAGLQIGCQASLPADAFERAVAAARDADAAIVVVGTSEEWESEGRDRTGLELPGRQDALVEAVAAANSRTVVVVVTGAPVRMDWAARVAAILWQPFPGQEGGHALADVLLGEADPGGRLPTTFPARLEDTPAFLHHPGEAGEVRYGEGVFAGYRYFDTRRLEPLFPFGHGLSYARFAFGPLELARDVVGAGETVEASLELTNLSQRSGCEVVQLYVRDLESSLARPPRELCAFEKLTLAPGERRRVTFRLPPRALAAWDPRAHAFAAEPGEFELLAGASSRDLRASARLRLS